MLLMKGSDKLQFVVHTRMSRGHFVSDKLKFVGHRRVGFE